MTYLDDEEEPSVLDLFFYFHSWKTANLIYVESDIFLLLG
jgi:hypothetical protein